MRVRFFATLIEVAGRREVNISGVRTVKDLIEKLSEMYGDSFKSRIYVDAGRRRVKPGVVILVNGKSIYHLNGLDTELKEDDTVSIFPPVAGG